ncbi:MAG: multidrug efflux pump, partial [Bacteroidia bacterium]
FAVVLAGGTALATILSLYFVPAVFLVIRKPYLLTLLSREQVRNAAIAEKDEAPKRLVTGYR